MEEAGGRDTGEEATALVNAECNTTVGVPQRQEMTPITARFPSPTSPWLGSKSICQQRPPLGVKIQEQTRPLHNSR